MDKRSLAILEKAFCAEIDEAVSGGIGLMQTKSKIAEKLVESGHIEKSSTLIGERFPVTVEGYRLTHLGRLTYCLTCDERNTDHG